MLASRFPHISQSCTRGVLLPPFLPHGRGGAKDQHQGTPAHLAQRVNSEYMVCGQVALPRPKVAWLAQHVNGRQLVVLMQLAGHTGVLRRRGEGGGGAGIKGGGSAGGGLVNHARRGRRRDTYLLRVHKDRD